MQIVPSTFIALIAVAILLRLGLRRGYWVFFALSPLGAAAAFNLPAIGGASFGLKEFAAITVAGLVLATRRGPDNLVGTLRIGQPGFFLAALTIYCTVSAIWAPAVFQGATEVFSISRSANSEGIISTPLRPGSGNITQFVSFIISVLGFLAFATIARLYPDPRAILSAMIAATVVHVVLGFLDVASAAAGMSWLLDPIRTANYSILVDHSMNGVTRMIGGFPEASSFGAFSLGLFGFWLHHVLNTPVTRVSAALLALSLFVVLRSTSSGAYLALVIFLAAYAAYYFVSRVRGVMTRRIAATAFTGIMLFWFCTLMVFSAYEFVDPVSAYLDRTIFDKLDSQSGVERMSWNAQAFKNFVDTWLLGAGLGSVRASNWLIACLGNIGLPGTLLFIAFLAAVLNAPVRTADRTATHLVGSLKSACFALFLADLLIAATPNFGVFFFALAGVATGLARSTVLAPASARPIAEPA